MKNRRILARLGAIAAVVLGLALLTPAGPATAAGAVTVPITLATAPTQPVRFAVSFHDRNGVLVQSGTTVDQPAGTQYFEASAVPPAEGSYYVSVVAYSFNSGIQQNWARMYVGGTRFWEDATPVTVGSGGVTTTGVTLQEATRVEGTTSTSPSTGVTTSAARVELRQLDTVSGQYRVVDRYTAESDGFFQWTFVEPGSYELRSESVDSRPVPTSTGAFTTSVGTTTTKSITISANRTWGAARLAGPDRFATAVAITQHQFAGDPVGIPVLYVANGLNYPDALAAGPAAAYVGGALLTVTPTDIPDVVADEIERLAPARIVIVGGPTNVSAAVAAELEEYAPDVDRIAGADRYATSRMLVADAFQCPGPDCAAPAVFIATGANYPDALSAGAAAGILGAPVLLVDGSAATVATATASLIDDLDPRRIYILGGETSVSAGIASALAGSALWVDRLAGADRFATSALVATQVVKRSSSVFGATGLNFADALVGGPLAASLGAPILLAQKTCMNVSVHDAIYGVDAGSVTYLGSTASIGTVMQPDSAMICESMG